MQMGLYLHRHDADVWRVVSEETDAKHQSFLLIDCTGWIVTANAVPPDTQLFQHIAKFY